MFADSLTLKSSELSAQFFCLQRMQTDPGQLKVLIWTRQGNEKFLSSSMRKFFRRLFKNQLNEGHTSTSLNHHRCYKHQTTRHLLKLIDTSWIPIVCFHWLTCIINVFWSKSVIFYNTVPVPRRTGCCASVTGWPWRAGSEPGSLRALCRCSAAWGNVSAGSPGRHPVEPAAAVWSSRTRPFPDSLPFATGLWSGNRKGRQQHEDMFVPLNALINSDGGLTEGIIRFQSVSHLSVVDNQLEESVHQQDSIWQDTAAVQENRLWRADTVWNEH